MSSNSSQGNPFKTAFRKSKPKESEQAASPFRIAKKDAIPEKAENQEAPQQPSSPAKEQDIPDSSIQNVSTPSPEPATPAPEPATPSPEPAKTTPIPDTANQTTNTTNQVNTNTDTSVSAMCLRAIYGVTENLTTEELIAKANNLSGVKSLTKISLAEIEALDLIQTQTFGLVGCEGLKLSVDSGQLHFITVEDTHLAVITDSDYAPGVKETITLTAERIAEIS